MTSFLILIYQFWPWREHQFQGSWQWLSWLTHLGNLAIFEGLSRILGSLFIIPCIYAYFAFHLRGSVVLTLISLATICPLMSSMWNSIEPWIANIIYLLVPVLLTTLINVELRLRSRDKQHFLELAKERQLHLSKIIEADEKARQRIARELHDESMQTLLAIASHTERLRSIEDIDQIKTRAVWIEKNIRSTVAELRRISLDLRPTILDDLGLVPALRWLIDQPALKENLQIQLNTSGNEVKLLPEMELAVFRIVQEALNNIKKHAQAKNAVINLRFTQDLLTLTIRDDGKGFRVPGRLTSLAVKGKLGLINIQDRIQQFGGKLVVSSKENGGTLLSIEMHISPPVK